MNIVQISSTATEQYFYVTGLGDDGKVYLWNAINGEWELHERPQQD